MFGRKKLLERIAALEAALSQAVPEKAPPVDAALAAFATAAIDSRAKELESMGGFLRTLSEIGAERAARAMGKRRASNAKRQSNGRFLPNPGSQKKASCRLCRDPMLRDPTIDEIKAHATHNDVTMTSPGITYTHEPDRIVAHVPEGMIETNADGAEVVECPECGGKHGRTIH